MTDASKANFRSAPTGEPPLPYGWTQEIDLASGKPYYIYKGSDWITFSRPIGLSSSDSPCPPSSTPFPTSRSPANPDSPMSRSPPPPYVRSPPTRQPRLTDPARTQDKASIPAPIPPLPPSDLDALAAAAHRRPSGRVASPASDSAKPTSVSSPPQVVTGPSLATRRHSVSFAPGSPSVIGSPRARETPDRRSSGSSPSSTLPPATNGSTSFQSRRSSLPRGSVAGSSTFLPSITDPHVGPTDLSFAGLGSARATSSSSYAGPVSSYTREPDDGVSSGYDDGDTDGASVFSFDTDIAAARLRGQAAADAEAARIAAEQASIARAVSPSSGMSHLHALSRRRMIFPTEDESGLSPNERARLIKLEKGNRFPAGQSEGMALHRLRQQQREEVDRESREMEGRPERTSWKDRLLVEELKRENRRLREEHEAMVDESMMADHEGFMRVNRELGYDSSLSSLESRLLSSTDGGLLPPGSIFRSSSSRIYVPPGNYPDSTASTWGGFGASGSSGKYLDRQGLGRCETSRSLGMAPYDERTFIHHELGSSAPSALPSSSSIGHFDDLLFHADERMF